MTSEASRTAAPLLKRGQRVGGRYVVEGLLGQGAQGVVFRAVRDDGVTIALKVLHRHYAGEERVAKRFHREASILKRLDGEHLVRLHDFLQEDGLLIIAFDFVEGETLEELLKQKTAISTKQAIEITLQVCAALGCAHAAGVVHRDLKPGNVLIEGHHLASGLRDRSVEARDSTNLRVRVVDFGLAKVVHGDHVTTGLTEHDMIFGTPAYMAPEQIRGEDADGRADLYAAGVMLFEMAIGKPPFTGRTPLAVMTAHLTEEVPPPRSSKPEGAISAALEAVILRALAKSPEDRYATAREFAEALAAARDEQRIIAAPASVAPSGGSPDSVVIATSDTDLNLLGAAALASMKTLPVDGSARVQPVRPQAPSAVATTTEGAAAGGVSEAPKTKPSEQARAASSPLASRDLDEPIVVPTESGRTWLWAAVAIAFALVGVLIGAIIGSR